MVIMTVEIIQMKMSTIAHSTRAHQMNSDVIMADVSSKHGNVIMKMIARMDQMKLIVNIPPVLMVNLLV